MKDIYQIPFLRFGLAAAFLPIFVVAFQDGVAPAAVEKAPERLTVGAIDAMLQKAWADAGLKEATIADDSEWLRRATISLNGMIPTADEVSAFLKDHSQDKRSKKIDALIERNDFGEHLGGAWTLMLIGRQARGQRFDRPAFSKWVVESFNKNMPFNQFTKEVITATGKSEDSPAVGFIERWRENNNVSPKDLAGQTAKTFLGLQIQCARCHDHKDQQWTQQEFNEFAAYFSNTTTKRVGMVDNRPIEEVVDGPELQTDKYLKKNAKKRAEELAKKAKDPEAAMRRIEQETLKRTTPSPLRPLTEGPLAVAPAVNAYDGPEADRVDTENVDTKVQLTRRERLAEWMTRKGNPYYARSIVNTTFAELFGYGLINPIDDFRSDSTIAIPELLEALALEFENSNYDYKHLVSLLAKSKAFSLASAGNAKEKSDVRESHEKTFARFPMRPMSPEQLIDSVNRATGIDESAEKNAKALKGKARSKKAEKAIDQAMQGYNNLRQQFVRKFVTTFDDDESAEGIDFEGTIPQALLMMNSKLIATAISRGYTLEKAKDDKDPVGWIYLSILSRKPSSEERNKADAYISRNGGKAETYEDLIWALLNSTEFSTIH
ncbi:MAG: DUF1549 domain-containing protein [Planctomycetota bacterium]